MYVLMSRQWFNMDSIFQIILASEMPEEIGRTRPYTSIWIWTLHYIDLDGFNQFLIGFEHAYGKFYLISKGHS